MSATPSLYQQVISVTSEYLGPAAPRFIDRQIQNHLHKEPHELTPKDLPVLIEWSKVAIALLTDSREVVVKYVEELNMLYRNAK